MYKNKNKLLGLILGASFLSINFVSAMETSSSQPGINVAGEKAQPDAQQAMVSVGAKLESILTSHPRVEKARGSVCEASFSIAEKRAGFFPKLNLSVSGGDKVIDKTTRGDAFGGTNSPEYDGKGIDLTLSLSQRLYDWGMTRAEVASATLTRGSTSFQGNYVLQTQISEFYNSAFDYLASRERLAALEEAAIKIRANVKSIEARYKPGATRISDLRAGQVLLLDLEMAIAAAKNESNLSGRVLKSQFNVDGKFVEDAAKYFLARLAAERARDEHESIISGYRAEAAEELANVRTVAEQAGAKEDALKGRVEHAAIRSPVTGVVSAVYVKTLGGVVQQGTMMAEIVPDEKALLIRAKIPVEDISSVFVNQPANVSLSSYDPARFGSLKGTVRRIASNSTSEERMPPYYETMVEIPDPRFSKASDEVEVVPGMTATVDLIGKKRTVLNYILTPIERASGVVFREK